VMGLIALTFFWLVMVSVFAYSVWPQPPKE
jgi:hypothetical protein